jgi:GNAT superfamily N-acetyltransferase
VADAWLEADAGPEARARALDDNFAALLAHYARGVGGEVDAASDLVLSTTRLPSRIVNAAVAARLSIERADRRIADALAFFARTDRPWRWLVGPSNEPDDLPDRLARAGLVQVGESTAMTLELHRHAAQPPEPSDLAGLDIHEVASEADFEIWHAVQQATLPLERPAADAWRRVHAALGYGPSGALRNFVAELDGRPVGAAALFIGAGVAGIYNVSTVADLRGHGIGRATTSAALDAGLAKGAAIATLGASPLGLPVYLRLGFTGIGRLRSFAVPDQAP